MKKWIKYLISIIGMLTILCTAGCSLQHQSLSGAYKMPNTTDDNTEQPDYFYFKKNGKVLQCTPKVNSTNKKSDTEYWYGDVYRGTWKSLGNNEYQIKLHDVYDNDYYTFKAKVKGNKLITYSNAKTAKYRWYGYSGKRQPYMTYSDYMTMFNEAKVSDQKRIQENGYTKPDNPSSTTVKIKNGDEALAYIKKQKGDQGFNLNGGTFGESDHPHASISDKSGHLYYVYQNGQIVKKN